DRAVRFSRLPWSIPPAEGECRARTTRCGATVAAHPCYEYAHGVPRGSTPPVSCACTPARVAPLVEERGESRPASGSRRRRGRLSSECDSQRDPAGSQHDVVAVFATRLVLREHACAIAEIDPHRSGDIAAQSGNQARAALTQRHVAALAAQAVDTRQVRTVGVAEYAEPRGNGSLDRHAGNRYRQFLCDEVL